MFRVFVHLGKVTTMPGLGKICLIGRSEQQVHLQLMLHLEFRVHFWLVHSCVQFATKADQEGYWVWA